MYKIILISPLIFLFVQCSYFRHKDITKPELTIIETNSDLSGYPIEISFFKGPEHNHPLMAIWIEDTTGSYVQTLYVAESIAKGFFTYGETSSGKWMPGPIRRPAALPYWSHRRGVIYEDGLYVPTHTNPLPDAISGATPKDNFILKTKTKDRKSKKFRILFEINQTWDWNEYWTNNKYPDDDDYKSSSQPALVYLAEIDLSKKQKDYLFQVIGHSHYAGRDGILNTDLSTMTTALNIVENIKVRIKTD